MKLHLTNFSQMEIINISKVATLVYATITKIMWTSYIMYVWSTKEHKKFWKIAVGKPRLCFSKIVFQNKFWIEQLFWLIIFLYLCFVKRTWKGFSYNYGVTSLPEWIDKAAAIIKFRLEVLLNYFFRNLVLV